MVNSENDGFSLFLLKKGSLFSCQKVNLPERRSMSQEAKITVK